MDDQTLLKKIKILVRDERILLNQILDDLREIETRRLYAELGYSSLYEYSENELEYSTFEAHQRINASRLMQNSSIITEKIHSNAFNLTQLAQVAQTVKSLSKNNIEIKQGPKKEELIMGILSKVEGKTT